MSFIAIQYGYGLMGGASSGLVGCNGYDRYRLGWMSQENNTGWPITASGMPSDISRESGPKSFILRDFITSGDVIRVKLPYLSPLASNQYIWLENHKILPNTLDYLQYSNTNTCRPQAQKGIYAYYQVGRDVLQGAYNLVYSSYDTDNLRMICANGNYDQVYRNTAAGNCLAPGNFQYFADTLPNPLAGNNDLSAYYIDIPGDDTLKPGFHAKHAEAKAYFSNPNHTIQNLPFLMSDINPFHGNKVMSLSTNPAPLNAVTYYHAPEGHPIITVPQNAEKNVPDVYLTGLKIEMTPLQDNDYKVGISWNNYDLQNDVRWTGNIILSEKLIVNAGVTLLLDQNLTPNTIYRDTITGLFSSATLLKCRNGSLMEQQRQSNVVVQNKSTLLIETGSHYIIDGSTLTVKAGSKLEIESCALLEIRNGGRLIIEPQGIICVHTGSLFEYESMQNFLFMPGFSTGECIEFNAGTFENIIVAHPPTYTIQGTVNWKNKIYNFSEDLHIEPGAVLKLDSNCVLRFG
ncbi:MAG: hypothetical protein Q8M92_10600, partial [Candidatus Subteraquimicrobiales bacterium]|nr:hypothetical protein [Candidatus Subteraquimicrobiales bacterium]